MRRYLREGAVHPRVGGGALPIAWMTRYNCGPSPRGRGSLADGVLELEQEGSIPAWAGEPS